MRRTNEEGERTRGRRSTSTPGDGHTSLRWRRIHRAATIVVVGAASVVALQLGLSGPLLSPVASPAVNVGTTSAAGAGASADNGTAAPPDQRHDDGAAGTRGDGGHGGGRDGAGQRGR